MKEKHNTNGMTREEYRKEIKRIHNEMRKLVDRAANPSNDLSTLREILLEGDKLAESHERLLFSSELWDGLFGVLPASDGLKSEAALEAMTARGFHNEFFYPVLSVVAKIVKDMNALVGINERIKEREGKREAEGTLQQEALKRVEKRIEEAKAEKERGWNLMDACSNMGGWLD